MPYHLWAKMWHPEDPPSTSFGRPKNMWRGVYFMWSGEIFLRIFLSYPPPNIPGLKGGICILCIFCPSPRPQDIPKPSTHVSQTHPMGLTRQAADVELDKFQGLSFIIGAGHKPVAPLSLPEPDTLLSCYLDMFWMFLAEVWPFQC